MPSRKSDSIKEGLKTLKEEILHQFHIISEDNRNQIKKIIEGLVIFSDNLDRFHEEIKTELADKFKTLLTAITGLNEKLDQTRMELKSEIQRIRQELRADIFDTR